MRIVGIKVGSRSLLTAKRDGTVIWNPPIDVPPHTFPWSTGSRTQTNILRPTINLRSSTVIAPETLLRALNFAHHRGTVLEGPIYNVDNGFWWYRILWDDAELPNMATGQGCWVGADSLEVVVENRAPVASPQSLTATVGTPIVITLSATDADGDDITYTVTSLPTKGTLTDDVDELVQAGVPLISESLTYAPTEDGSDAISFNASDGFLSSDALIEVANAPVTAPITLLGLQLGVGQRLNSNSLDSIVFTAASSYTARELRGRLLEVPATRRLRMAIYAGSDANATLLGHTTVMTPNAGVNNLPLNADVAIVAGQTYMISVWVSSTGGSLVWSANDETGTRLRRAVLLDETGPFPNPYGAVSTDVATTYAVWAGEEVTVTPPTPEPPPPPPGETPPTATATPQTSITKGLITWTFDKPYLCGNYANGDWFVVAPTDGAVTITNITPASVTSPRAMHGSMLNPLAGFANDHSQGFDKSGPVPYQDVLNVGRPGGNPISAANPLAITGGSLLSSQSVLASGQRPQLQEVQILTVVAAVPPFESFRPPYCGTTKLTGWNTSQLNYGALQSLPAVNPSNVPDLTNTSREFRYPWIEIHTNVQGRHIHPKNNQPDYGRDMGYFISDALLSLQLNYSDAQKKELLVRIVQYGLDIYGAALTGGNWRDNGGHNHGRKAVMLVAGKVLNDANILQRGDRALYHIFMCDRQMFYVTEDDKLRGHDHHTYTGSTSFSTSADVSSPSKWNIEVLDHMEDTCGFYIKGDGRRRRRYLQEHVGLPEWGEQHIIRPSRDASQWGAYYRQIVGSSLVGGILAIKMMGLKSAWNNPVVFDYYETRWVPRQIPNASNVTNAMPLFEADMWTAYSNLIP